MGILSETFAHQLFEKRTLATYLLVESILRYTNDHAADIQNCITQADQRTITQIIAEAGKLTKGVRFQRISDPELVEILVRETETYEDSNGRRRMRQTGKIRWADSISHYNAFEATLESTVPRYYYFKAKHQSIAKKLMEHGISVDQVTKKERLEASVFVVESFKKNERSRYPGHKPVQLDGYFETKKMTFKPGDFKIDLAQPLAWLIFYLLEPQADDGLVYWNYFDEFLEANKAGEKAVAFPVVKSW